MADDLTRLAADLSQAPRQAWPYIRKSIEVTARHIKNDWNNNLGGRSNSGSAFKHVGRTVDYTIGASNFSLARSALGLGAATGIEAEIGPNLGRAQGAMAGWFEEGMHNIPALHPGYDAMKRNEADFEHGLAEAVEDGLREVDL